MSKEVTQNTIVEEVLDPSVVYATIIKDDAGLYHVVDFDGTVGPACKLVDADDKTIALTKNKSNRQWFNRAKADAEIAEKGHCDLYYKATKHVGSIGSKLPNEKLISYLPDDLQAEYKAIIARAIEAKNNDKAKPMTELEKAQAKLLKAQEALAKLQAQAAGDIPTDGEPIVD